MDCLINKTNKKNSEANQWLRWFQENGNVLVEDVIDLQWQIKFSLLTKSSNHNPSTNVLRTSPKKLSIIEFYKLYI